MTDAELPSGPNEGAATLAGAARGAVQGETKLIVTAQWRRATRLDDGFVEPAPADPSVGELATLATRAAPDRPLWVAGGEPTLRADLPDLVRVLAKQRPGGIGMCTDGLALTEASAIAPLRAAGLTGVRLFLHSPRPEAHDWLVKQPGATRQVIRAARACAKAGLDVELEATLTRPTQSHLVDLVELAARLNVGALHLRRLRGRGAAAAAYLMLAPRFALLERPLAAALSAAEATHLPVVLRGHPPCAMARTTAHRWPLGAVTRLVPAGTAWQPLGGQLTEPVTAEPCSRCPELPICGGAPAAYVAAFGSRELTVRDPGAMGKRDD